MVGIKNYHFNYLPAWQIWALNGERCDLEFNGELIHEIRYLSWHAAGVKSLSLKKRSTHSKTSCQSPLFSVRTLQQIEQWFHRKLHAIVFWNLCWAGFPDFYLDRGKPSVLCLFCPEWTPQQQVIATFDESIARWTLRMTFIWQDTTGSFKPQFR